MINNNSLLKSSVFFLGLTISVFGIAIYSLRLLSYELWVPFNYNGDSVVILMYIKGLVQDGWPTTIKHLSAPFAYPGAAFPMLTSFDWVVIKILSFFFKEPGYLLNGFWLLTLVFSAWSSAYAAYQLGQSRIFSAASGVIYAFLPYALLRNVSHLNLVYYLVPLICLLAIAVVNHGSSLKRPKQAVLVGLVACAMQGFNYIYYSFFSAVLIGAASLIGYRRERGLRQFKLPLLAILIVSTSTMVNLLPAIQSWKIYGTPPDMGYKYVAEAEIYGAKLRRMIAPHPENLIRPLGKLGAKDVSANFPNENENITARLGLYGAIGLLLMIATVLRPRVKEGRASLEASSSLGLVTLLIITVGGFGVIINLLTVPDIRCYNRFSVFLSFFAIVVAGLWIQQRLYKSSSRSKKIGYCLAASLIVFSLYDQLLDVKGLILSQESDIKRAIDERKIVSRLEKNLPPGSAVLELPFTGFPPLEKINKMDSYDHLRPYLWSHDLRWSWPSFSQEHRAWQQRMSVLKGENFISAAVYSGFSAIWIDRFAYPDAAEGLIKELTASKAKQIDLNSDRFFALDLREVSLNLRASMSKADFSRRVSQFLGDGLIVEWGRGFYLQEKNHGGHLFRWAEDYSKLKLRNVNDSEEKICVSFLIAAPNEGTVHLEVDDLNFELRASTIPRLVAIPLTFQALESKLINFSAGMTRFNSVGDSRNLHFYIMDFNKDLMDKADSCNANEGLKKNET